MVERHGKGVRITALPLLYNNVFFDVQTADNILKVGAGKNVLILHRRRKFVKRRHLLQGGGVRTVFPLVVGNPPRDLLCGAVKRQRQLFVAVVDRKNIAVSGRLFCKFDLCVGGRNVTAVCGKCVVNVLPYAVRIQIMDRRIVLRQIAGPILQAEGLGRLGPPVGKLKYFSGFFNRIGERLAVIAKPQSQCRKRKGHNYHNHCKQKGNGFQGRLEFTFFHGRKSFLFFIRIVKFRL